MAVPIEDAAARFRAHFGAAPAWAARAPGRVNLIGEHTDYNGGYVLPMAIDREALVLARPRRDGRMRLYSARMDEEISADLAGIEAHPPPEGNIHWSAYAIGVAREAARLGFRPRGFDALIDGDIPLGRGLSSSAALEMALLKLLEALQGHSLDATEAARLGQRVENGFIGVQSGIMDQFIARAARQGHALLLDCKTLAARHIPAQLDGAAFLVADSGVDRRLAASAYNARVKECAEAVKALNLTGRPGDCLRDFTMEDLDSIQDAIPEVILRRARHVISENERTLAAAMALEERDARTLGALFNASDASLREDYAVTGPELDALTAAGRASPGGLGSRMTGAGFGGCTLHVVESQKIPEFMRGLRVRGGLHSESDCVIFPAYPAEGAKAVALEG